MASGVYDSGKVALMGADIDLINTPLSVMLVDLALYSPDLVQDNSLVDIPEAARIAEVILVGKTIDVTTLRADDAVFNSVPAEEGKQVTGVILFKEAETYSGSTLICLFDNAPEFPITPDGTDITIQWDTGSDGIFRL